MAASAPDPTHDDASSQYPGSRRALRLSNTALWIILAVGFLVAVIAFFSYAITGGVGPTSGGVTGTGTTFETDVGAGQPPPPDALHDQGAVGVGGHTGPTGEIGPTDPVTQRPGGAGSAVGDPVHGDDPRLSGSQLVDPLGETGAPTGPPGGP